MREYLVDDYDHDHTYQSSIILNLREMWQ